MREKINAILCYHNHHDYLDRCIISLDKQVDDIIIVDDASDRPPHSPFYRTLHVPNRLGPAASFNYGVSKTKSNPDDWFLYVDPHTVFAPKSLGKMLKLASDDYDFVLGTGYVSFLDPAGPWAKVLKKSDFITDVPLTFLIKRALWDTLDGIPEPAFCHMDHLAKHLFQKGIVYAKLNGMCYHDVHGDLMDVVRYYYMNGYSYAKSGLETDAVKIAKTYTTEHLKQLLSGLFSCAQGVGAMEGLGLLPEEPLDMVQVGLTWEEPDEEM